MPSGSHQGKPLPSCRPDQPRIRAQVLGRYVMRMPISPEDGHAAGPPRQVSLEGGFSFAISPDDRWIAYVSLEAMASTDRMSNIRVLPSTGGNARTVGTVPGFIMAIRWGAEGRFLYFLHWPGPDAEELVVMRVPVEGGEPERLSAWESTVRLSRHARFLFRELPSEGEDGKRYEVSTVEGNRLARVHLPDPFDLVGFAEPPGRLLAVRVDVANPLRVLPVAGGPVQRLNRTGATTCPWTGVPMDRKSSSKPI